MSTHDPADPTDREPADDPSAAPNDRPRGARPDGPTDGGHATSPAAAGEPAPADAAAADADEADRLSRRWIELREEGTVATHVFVADGPDVPLGRGRKVMDLRGDRAVQEVPGPDDRPVGRGGSWQRDGDHLVLRLPDWDGTWAITDLTDERLVLRRLD